MISLKKILYIIGSVTSGDDTKYMSVRDICDYFSDEDCDLATISNRINSQLRGHLNLFSTKKVGKSKFWRLNGNGRKYLDKFIDLYDPINDKMLIQPDNDMRIYRPTNKIEVI